MTLNKTLLAITLLGISSTALYAQELNGTLKKIKETGIITIGHRESSIPFSYYGAGQKVIGYSQDYSNLVVEKIKETLNMPSLKVNFLPITSKTRIPLLQNGSYDIECGSTTNNIDRQRQAAFSNTIFIVATRFLVRSNSKIEDLAGLKGKNVVVTAGTTSDVILNQLNEKDKLNLRLITPKDHGDAFITLETGRALAFLMDDALLAGERSKARDPSKWKIVGEPLSYEAYACMLRKDDPAFKALVDTVVADAQTSGEATSSYQRWFNSPIPPRGVVMDLELSDKMKALFAAPNDNAFN